MDTDGYSILNHPERLAVIVLVVFSAVFFIRNGISFYATVDFSARGLGDGEASDFFVFYSTARMMWENALIGDLYDFSLLKAFQVTLGAAEAGQHPFNYPPTYLFFIWPLGALSYPVALITWQSLNLVILVIALHVAGLRRWEVVATMVAPATVLNFAAGQNGCFTTALLISGLALLGRRQISAGGLFGLLTIKPHLGLLLPVVCLAQRRWQSILVAAFTTFALIGASIVAFGPDSWTAYLEFLVEFQERVRAQITSDFMKYSASVLLAEQFIGLPKAFAYFIQIAISVGVAVIVYLAFRRPISEDLRMILVLVGVSLVTPFGFLYDLPFIAVATVLMTRIGLRDGFLPLEAFWLAAIWFTPYLSVFFMERGIPVAPWTHLIFFCYVLARIGQEVAAGNEQPAPSHPQTG